MTDDEREYPELGLLFKICYLGFFINGLSGMMLGALLPYFRSSYGLSYESAGMMLSSQSIGNLLGMALYGFFALIGGRRKTVIFFALWTTVAYLLFYFFKTPLPLLLGSFFTGFSRAGCSNFGNTILATYTDSRSGGINVLHALYALGAFFSPLIPITITCVLGERQWRLALIFMALAGTVQVMMYMYASVPKNPRRRDAADYSTAFLHNKIFWSASFVLLSYSAAEYGLVGWFVTYFKDTGMMGLKFAQSMSGVLWLLICAGRFLCARLLAVIPPHKLLVLNGGGFLVGFLMMLYGGDFYIVMSGIIVAGFFMSATYPNTVAAAKGSLAGNDIAMTVLTTMGAIGGVTSPAAIGMIAERTGIAGGMALLTFLTLLTLIAAVINAWLVHRSCAA